MERLTAPKPFAPSLTDAIRAAAVRCLARLARPARRAEVRARVLQQRTDAAAQAEAREARR